MNSNGHESVRQIGAILHFMFTFFKSSRSSLICGSLRLGFLWAFFFSFCVQFPLFASEFKHVGDFLLQSHFKLTGDQVTPIPMKPIAFRVYTDGIQVKVSAEGDEESHTTFEIYRSDGIARQRAERGALEVIPGLQATTQTGGILRHLRLSSESMTITSFPGVSNQTIISHAIAAEPKTETPSK